MIPFMSETVCCVLALFYFRDFAIVNFNSSSNFVIEHFRRTYPPDLQESDGGAIHRVSNYPDLLPEMPRYCCPLVI